MGKYKDNPWLGLESYQENQHIYGRDIEIEELSQCVLNNNETVLFGKSGIGKSSIINAGIIPVIRNHGYVPVIVRLDHSNKHPYTKQLSSLIEAGTTVSECVTSKPAEEQLLWEYFHTHRFGKTSEGQSKLVIIFDQFEEIFTLQGNTAAKKQFFRELGDVLNDVMPKELAGDAPCADAEAPQPDVPKREYVSGFADMADLFPALAASVNNTACKYIEDNDIHFVFIIREDFLSEFEYHTFKIPSLKQHRYALRPLNEEQAAEVIMKPRPGLVDKEVARLIIETVTNRKDFTLGYESEIDVDAAVLSLFLNQIFDKRPKEEATITVDLVKTFGRDIIKEFYLEAIKGLTPEQIDFLEEELLTGENRRDSLSKSDFMAGGFSDVDMNRLINEKKLLRQFHYERDLRIEFVHDILCPVVKAHRLERHERQQMQEKDKRIKMQKRCFIAVVTGFFIILAGLYCYLNSNAVVPICLEVQAPQDHEGWQINVSYSGTDDIKDIIPVDSDNPHACFFIKKKKLAAMNISVDGMMEFNDTCIAYSDEWEIRNDTIVVPVELAANPENIVIQGTVTDNRDSTLSGCLVAIEGKSMITDNNGKFRFVTENLLEGSYYASLRGYKSKNGKIKVKAIKKGKSIQIKLIPNDNLGDSLDTGAETHMAFAQRDSISEDAPLSDEELEKLRKCSLDEKFLSDKRERIPYYRSYYYAIHGYIFQSSKMLIFFKSQKEINYKPIKGNISNDIFTDNEQRMLKLIRFVEKKNTSRTLVITGDSVPLRKAPTIGSDKEYQVDRGTKVQFLESAGPNDEWRKIKYKGQILYVLAELTQFSSE